MSFGHRGGGLVASTPGRSPAQGPKPAQTVRVLPPLGFLLRWTGGVRGPSSPLQPAPYCFRLPHHHRHLAKNLLPWLPIFTLSPSHPPSVTSYRHQCISSLKVIVFVGHPYAVRSCRARNSGRAISGDRAVHGEPTISCRGKRQACYSNRKFHARRPGR